MTGPAGNPVALTTYAGDLRYDVPPVNPTRVGQAIASFDATAAGSYTISARAAPGTGGTIAIVSDLLWNAAPHIIGIIAVFLAGAGAGLTLIIVTAVRRNSARRVAAAPRQTAPSGLRSDAGDWIVRPPRKRYRAVPILISLRGRRLRPEIDPRRLFPADPVAEGWPHEGQPARSLEHGAR